MEEHHADQAEATYWEARLAYEGNDLLRCMQLLETSLALRAHHKSFELLGTCLFDSGEHARAIEVTKSALQLNPNSDKTACLLAKYMLHVGADLEECRIVVDEVLQRNATYGPAMALREQIASNRRS